MYKGPDINLCAFESPPSTDGGSSMATLVVGGVEGQARVAAGGGIAAAMMISAAKNGGGGGDGLTPTTVLTTTTTTAANHGSENASYAVVGMVVGSDLPSWSMTSSTTNNNNHPRQSGGDGGGGGLLIPRDTSHSSSSAPLIGFINPYSPLSSSNSYGCVGGSEAENNNNQKVVGPGPMVPMMDIMGCVVGDDISIGGGSHITHYQPPQYHHQRPHKHQPTSAVVTIGVACTSFNASSAQNSNMMVMMEKEQCRHRDGNDDINANNNIGSDSSAAAATAEPNKDISVNVPPILLVVKNNNNNKPKVHLVSHLEVDHHSMRSLGTLQSLSDHSVPAVTTCPQLVPDGEDHL